jgi:hypothetical protein
MVQRQDWTTQRSPPDATFSTKNEFSFLKRSSMARTKYGPYSRRTLWFEPRRVFTSND